MRCDWLISRVRRLGQAGLALCLLGQNLWAEQQPVDIQLIALADVSDSMHADIGALQRQGYAMAFRSENVVRSMTYGVHGRIGFAYLEWGDVGRVDVVVPWTLIDSVEAAAKVADRLEKRRVNTFLKTSISHALRFSHGYFDASSFSGERVIDISGNGPNNQGPQITRMRDEVVADGVTINGLPILAGIERPRGTFGTGFDLRLLDLYYEDCVIGGPGAFTLPVYDEDDLARAIQLKLVLEIAFQPRIFPVRATATRPPRVPC